MSQDMKRQQFEAFFLASRSNKGAKRRPTFERLPDDTYADDHTQRHWWTWQQALAAEPLTEERIDEIARGWVMSLGGDHWYSGERGIKDDSDLHSFVRAIERAHGIGAAKDQP